MSAFVVPGILFVLTLGLGFWLSRAGQPYNGLLFNGHKLIVLGGVVVTAVQLVRILRGADTSVLWIAVLALAALCVLALFVSGGLMSAGRLDHALLHTIHRIALAALVILATAFLLRGLAPAV